MSFLIATPQTGVDSIIATYSLMGLPFAILRPVAALCTALFGGLMVNRFASDGKSETTVKTDSKTSKEEFKEIIGRGWGRNLWGVLKYAFFDMMQDIGKWLVIGLVVAGLITVFVPDTFFATFQGNTLLSIALVLAFAIPMYLCATGSIPIAVALMLKGLSPGGARQESCFLLLALHHRRSNGLRPRHRLSAASGMVYRTAEATAHLLCRRFVSLQHWRNHRAGTSAHQRPCVEIRSEEEGKRRRGGRGEVRSP